MITSCAFALSRREERMLKSRRRLDSQGGVILEHLVEEVKEVLQVFSGGLSSAFVHSDGHHFDELPDGHAAADHVIILTSCQARLQEPLSGFVLVEEKTRFLATFKDVPRGYSELLNDESKLVPLILARKQCIPHMEFHHHTCQAPDVDATVIRDVTNNYLWSSVKSRLYVQRQVVRPHDTRPKVNNFDLWPLWVPEQDIFWLQVRVDHIDFGLRQKIKTDENLFRKLLDKLHGHSVEICTT
mmetsp:Transcript_3421/g.10376  ORF Transcript_3421/g.10376 Transcript_3421/m.10376 type:complete len:242 (-) Transcript_3421:1010-1735(-)